MGAPYTVLDPIPKFLFPVCSPRIEHWPLSKQHSFLLSQISTSLASYTVPVKGMRCGREGTV